MDNLKDSLISKRWTQSTLVLVAVVTLCRVYLAGHLGLGDDEAYYWDWIHWPAFSYFDHPAVTAWLITVSHAIFGDTSFAVRLPCLLCNLVTTVFLWRLAREMFDERVAALSVILFLFAPIFVVGGILMVPDAPMAAAWMIFSYLLWKIYSRARLGQEIELKWWIFAGLAMGIGLISKYTIFLLSLAGLLLMLSEAKTRATFKTKGPWIAILLAVLCCTPILVWNIQYDWASIRFHLQDRQTGGGGFNSTRGLQFIISQAAAVGPALLIVSLSTLLVAFNRLTLSTWRFIAFVSVPPLLIFSTQAFFAEFKPHWPAPAYPVLFIGASQWFFSGFGIASNWLRKTMQWTAAVLVVLFFAIVNPLFYVGSLYPIVPRLVRLFAPAALWEAKFDPTNDLYGWDEAAAEVKRIRSDMLKQGLPEPFLSAYRYQLVAQLAFATGERVWKVSDTRDQYTFVQTREEMRALKGRDSLYVYDQRFPRDPNNDNLFQACEQKSQLDVKREGELAHTFYIWLCHGYSGYGG